MCLASHIRETHDGVGVRHVKLATDKNDTEGRIQMVNEGCSNIRNSVAIGVSQQRYTVAAWRGRPRQGLDLSLDIIFGPVDRRIRAVCFNDQHVAIWQGIDHARMFEACCECMDLQAGRHHRRLALLPANPRGDRHRRHEILLGCR